MLPDMHQLEAIVRKKICPDCEFRPAACQGEEIGGRCKLFDLFPLVAQAIHGTESDDIRDYERAIRENVCSVCVDQRLDGTCERREEERCALDAHLPAIIEAIEEATGRKFDRTAAPGR